MKPSARFFTLLCCLTFPLIACAALSRASTATPVTTAPNTDTSTLSADPSTTMPVTGAYNPSSDPAADLQKSIRLAQKENKRILVEVGGEWCVWCHIMDRFYETHPALLKLREDNYVLLKVNYSEENQNAAFLSRYPAIPGFPHIFILESDGTLLHSQNTSELEDGQSYHLARFTAFLTRWAKP
jgi:thiol:disulfide interchange protein